MPLCRICSSIVQKHLASKSIASNALLESLLQSYGGNIASQTRCKSYCRKETPPRGSNQADSKSVHTLNEQNEQISSVECKSKKRSHGPSVLKSYVHTYTFPKHVVKKKTISSKKFKTQASNKNSRPDSSSSSKKNVEIHVAIFNSGIATKSNKNDSEQSQEDGVLETVLNLRDNKKTPKKRPSTSTSSNRNNTMKSSELQSSSKGSLLQTSQIQSTISNLEHNQEDGVLATVLNLRNETKQKMQPSVAQNLNKMDNFVLNDTDLKKILELNEISKDSPTDKATTKSSGEQTFQVEANVTQKSFWDRVFKVSVPKPIVEVDEDVINESQEDALLKTALNQHEKTKKENLTEKSPRSNLAVKSTPKGQEGDTLDFLHDVGKLTSDSKKEVQISKNMEEVVKKSSHILPSAEETSASQIQQAPREKTLLDYVKKFDKSSPKVITEKHEKTLYAVANKLASDKRRHNASKLKQNKKLETNKNIKIIREMSAKVTPQEHHKAEVTNIQTNQSTPKKDWIDDLINFIYGKSEQSNSSVVQETETELLEKNTGEKKNSNTPVNVVINSRRSFSTTSLSLLEKHQSPLLIKEESTNTLSKKSTSYTANDLFEELKKELCLLFQKYPHLYKSITNNHRRSRRVIIKPSSKVHSSVVVQKSGFLKGARSLNSADVVPVRNFRTCSTIKGFKDKDSSDQRKKNQENLQNNAKALAKTLIEYSQKSYRTYKKVRETVVKMNEWIGKAAKSKTDVTSKSGKSIQFTKNTDGSLKGDTLSGKVLNRKTFQRDDLLKLLRELQQQETNYFDNTKNEGPGTTKVMKDKNPVDDKPSTTETHAKRLLGNQKERPGLSTEASSVKKGDETLIPKHLRYDQKPSNVTTTPKEITKRKKPTTVMDLFPDKTTKVEEALAAKSVEEKQDGLGSYKELIDELQVKTHKPKTSETMPKTSVESLEKIDEKSKTKDKPLDQIAQFILEIQSLGSKDKTAGEDYRILLSKKIVDEEDTVFNVKPIKSITTYMKDAIKKIIPQIKPEPMTVKDKGKSVRSTKKDVKRHLDVFDPLNDKDEIKNYFMEVHEAFRTLLSKKIVDDESDTTNTFNENIKKSKTETSIQTQKKKLESSNLNIQNVVETIDTTLARNDQSKNESELLKDVTSKSLEGDRFITPETFQKTETKPTQDNNKQLTENLLTALDPKKIIQNDFRMLLSKKILDEDEDVLSKQEVKPKTFVIDDNIKRAFLTPYADIEVTDKDQVTENLLTALDPPLLAPKKIIQNDFRTLLSKKILDEDEDVLAKEEVKPKTFVIDDIIERAFLTPYADIEDTDKDQVTYDFNNGSIKLIGAKDFEMVSLEVLTQIVRETVDDLIKQNNVSHILKPKDDDGDKKGPKSGLSDTASTSANMLDSSMVQQHSQNQEGGEAIKQDPPGDNPNQNRFQKIEFPKKEATTIIHPRGTMNKKIIEFMTTNIIRFIIIKAMHDAVLHKSIKIMRNIPVCNNDDGKNCILRKNLSLKQTPYDITDLLRHFMLVKYLLTPKVSITRRSRKGRISRNYSTNDSCDSKSKRSRKRSAKRLDDTITKLINSNNNSNHSENLQEYWVNSFLKSRGLCDVAVSPTPDDNRIGEKSKKFEDTSTLQVRNSQSENRNENLPKNEWLKEVAPSSGLCSKIDDGDNNDDQEKMSSLVTESSQQINDGTNTVEAKSRKGVVIVEGRALGQHNNDKNVLLLASEEPVEYTHGNNMITELEKRSRNYEKEENNCSLDSSAPPKNRVERINQLLEILMSKLDNETDADLQNRITRIKKYLTAFSEEACPKIESNVNGKDKPETKSFNSKNEISKCNNINNNNLVMNSSVDDLLITKSSTLMESSEIERKIDSEEPSKNLQLKLIPQNNYNNENKSVNCDFSSEVLSNISHNFYRQLVDGFVESEISEKACKARTCLNQDQLQLEDEINNITAKKIPIKNYDRSYYRKDENKFIIFFNKTNDLIKETQSKISENEETDSGISSLHQEQIEIPKTVKMEIQKTKSWSRQDLKIPNQQLHLYQEPAKKVIGRKCIKQRSTSLHDYIENAKNSAFNKVVELSDYLIIMKNSKRLKKTKPLQRKNYKRGRIANIRLNDKNSSAETRRKDVQRYFSVNFPKKNKDKDGTGPKETNTSSAVKKVQEKFIQKESKLLDKSKKVSNDKTEAVIDIKTSSLKKDNILSTQTSVTAGNKQVQGGTKLLSNEKGKSLNIKIGQNRDVIALNIDNKSSSLPSNKVKPKLSQTEKVTKTKVKSTSLFIEELLRNGSKELDAQNVVVEDKVQEQQQQQQQQDYKNKRELDDMFASFLMKHDSSISETENTKEKPDEDPRIYEDDCTIAEELSLSSDLITEIPKDSKGTNEISELVNASLERSKELNLPMVIKPNNHHVLNLTNKKTHAKHIMRLPGFSSDILLLKPNDFENSSLKELSMRDEYEKLSNLTNPEVNYSNNLFWGYMSSGLNFPKLLGKIQRFGTYKHFIDISTMAQLALYTYVKEGVDNLYPTNLNLIYTSLKRFYSQFYNKDYNNCFETLKCFHNNYINGLSEFATIPETELRYNPYNSLYTKLKCSVYNEQSTETEAMPKNDQHHIVSAPKAAAWQDIVKPQELNEPKKLKEQDDQITTYYLDCLSKCTNESECTDYYSLDEAAFMPESKPPEKFQKSVHKLQKLKKKIDKNSPRAKKDVSKKKKYTEEPVPQNNVKSEEILSTLIIANEPPSNIKQQATVPLEDFEIQMSLNVGSQMEKKSIVRKTLTTMTMKLTEIVSPTMDLGDDLNYQKILRDPQNGQFINQISNVSVIKSLDNMDWNMEAKENKGIIKPKPLRVKQGMNMGTFITSDGNIAYKLESCKPRDQKENVYDVHELCVREIERKEKMYILASLQPSTLLCYGIDPTSYSEPNNTTTQ